jgi:hypothetical protein
MNRYRLHPYHEGKEAIGIPLHLEVIEAPSLKEAEEQVEALVYEHGYLDGIDITPIDSPRKKKTYKFSIYDRYKKYIGDWECTAFELGSAFLKVWELYNRDRFTSLLWSINGKSVRY